VLHCAGRYGRAGRISTTTPWELLLGVLLVGHAAAAGERRRQRRCRGGRRGRHRGAREGEGGGGRLNRTLREQDTADNLRACRYLLTVQRTVARTAAYRKISSCSMSPDLTLRASIPQGDPTYGPRHSSARAKLFFAERSTSISGCGRARWSHLCTPPPRNAHACACKRAQCVGAKRESLDYDLA